MSESATAEAAYYSHTLNRRPSPQPEDSALESERARDPRLAAISAHSLLPALLPPEIRAHIYALAFGGNRVAVTCSAGCYCAGTHTGPYRAEHRWLLQGLPGGSAGRMDAQRGFVEQALWEVHCPRAWGEWVGKLREVGVLDAVRDVRVNVFETSLECWELDTRVLVGLRSVTFCPWQMGWTCDVPALEGSVELSDERVMPLVRKKLETMAGYGWVWEMVNLGREKRGGWKVYFLLPVRYLYEVARDRKRWQLKVSFLSLLIFSLSE